MATEEMQQQNTESVFSKLIISPNNWWNMQRNDFTLLMFIVYGLLLPYKVSYSAKLHIEDVNSLFFFDILFIFDRVVDLFRRQKDNGQGEAKPTLLTVIAKNLSFFFFLEWFMGFGPIIYNNMLPIDESFTHISIEDPITKEKSEIEKFKSISPIMYFLFKIPRYVRIFEMQSQVSDILEFYS